MFNWFRKLFKRKPHIPLLDFRGHPISGIATDRREDSIEFIYVKKDEKVYRVNTRGGAFEEVIYYEEVGN